VKTRIQECGSGVAPRIPKRVASEVSPRENSAVHVAIQSGKLMVAIEEQQLSLDDLVGRITPRNRRSNVETGKAVGNEVW
jgi:antitoxin component of MazEF toxin-antitoxin module